MRSAIKSLTRYPARSVIYAALLTVSFVTTTVLLNTYYIALKLIEPFDELLSKYISYEERAAHMELFGVRDAIFSSMSSLIPAALLIILLCVLILPFLQYLFSIGRGYEIGILRALGMSKSRAWCKLLLENILLVLLSLTATQSIVLVSHKRFTRSLLAIDADMLGIMTETFPDIEKAFSYQWMASLYAIGSAVLITVITAGFCNSLISGNAPLKLIRNYK